MVSERRVAGPQRQREVERAFRPHLGDRAAGIEYRPKYTHQDIDAFIDAQTSEAPSRLGFFACFDVMQVASSVDHTVYDLADMGVGAGRHAEIDGGLVKFLTGGVYEVVAMAQVGEGGTSVGDWEFIVYQFDGAMTFYGPAEARGEWTAGQGSTLCVVAVVDAEPGSRMYASVQVNTTDANAQTNCIVTVKGPF